MNWLSRYCFGGKFGQIFEDLLASLQLQARQHLAWVTPFWLNLVYWGLLLIGLCETLAFHIAYSRQHADLLSLGYLKEAGHVHNNGIWAIDLKSFNTASNVNHCKLKAISIQFSTVEINSETCLNSLAVSTKHFLVSVFSSQK